MKLNTLFEGFSKQIYSKPNESSDNDSALSAETTNRLTKWANKKYRMLPDDSIQWDDHTLYRIQYKKDIIIDKYYFVKKDNLGGYIESLDNLSETGKCAIKNNAKVWGNAKVYGDAKIEDNAQIYDNAEVCGESYVGDNAEVYEDAKVCGNNINYPVTVYGRAKVHGHAQVTGGIVYEGLIK